MNAQNNTPQQRPAAAASTPTESDLWEAAFSSDDPTVVLTDEDLNAARRAHEKARESSASAQSSAQSSQDATRPLTEAATATQPVLSANSAAQSTDSGADLGEPATDNLSWLDKPATPSADNVRGGATSAPATPPAPATAPTAAASYEVPAPGNAHAASNAPQADPAADDHFVIPTPAGDAAGSEPILTAATALSMQKSRYSRMHLLPGLLGWLITISLMDGGLWAIQSWLTLTGQSESIEYVSVVSRLFSGASNAVPVAVALSVLIFFAYLVGGYAAGRMARFAGAKQGIAVWLWQIMALILGSLATFLTPQLFQNGVASLSLQKLIAGDFANGLLAVLLVLGLSFLGAILGGLLGRLYHRRVDKYPSDQVAREDA